MCFPFGSSVWRRIQLRGIKYSAEQNFHFHPKTFCLGKDSVGVGEICGGIISDISLHFVRCPLASAKFKITPFFTLDGKGSSLKQDFQILLSDFLWKKCSKTTKMTISKLSISFSNCNWMRRPPRACMIIFLLFSFHRYQLQEE